MPPPPIITTAFKAPLLQLDQAIVDAFLGPLIKVCCKLHIHPNAITLSSILTTIIMVYVHFTFKSPWIVGALMMYKWFADVLDGPVARRCRKTSVLGGLLDSAADFVFVVVVFVLFMNLLYPKVNTSYWWLVGTSLCSLNWIAGAWFNGVDVWHRHSDFKNKNNQVNTILWAISENTFVTTLIVALFYIVMAS